MGGGSSSVAAYPNLASFPVGGSIGVIYIAEDTNVLYRWDGVAYVEVSSAIYNYANLASFPVVGLTDAIYVANDTNYMYRFDGVGYVLLSPVTSNSNVAATLFNYYNFI